MELKLENLSNSTGNKPPQTTRKSDYPLDYNTINIKHYPKSLSLSAPQSQG